MFHQIFTFTPIQMKSLYIPLISIIALCFSSCETEVDLDLKTIEPRLVIDASIGMQTPCHVILSKTQDYDDQSYPTLISGAKVTLTDENGNKDVLRDLENHYESKMRGVEGRTYTLTVEVDGETYTATDKIPTFVPVDEISLYRLDTGGDEFYFPQITYKDPEGESNYYYYMLSINGKTMQATDFEDDKYTDGKKRERILYFDDKENNDEELKSGDHIVVKMQTLGEGAYTFYNTQSAPGGVPNSNPVSNFSGDVLGMFKTYCNDYIEMTITEEDFIK